MTKKEFSDTEHLYVHIPFCLSKCKHCDFFSIAEVDERLKERYISCVLKEAELYPVGEIETIYIGGGTPSALSTSLLKYLLGGLAERFEIGAPRQTGRANCEFTIEVNPGTISVEKLELFKEKGVNRLSIGVQSFNQKNLDLIGRSHNVQDSIDCFNAARKAGFDNLNIDLIFSFPGETLDEFSGNINRTLSLDPEHVSLYCLTIDPSTPLGEMVVEGKITRESEEDEAEKYIKAIEILEIAGFRQYEISNFARLGLECEHNLAYWQRKNYLGLGAGAHSLFRASAASGEARCERRHHNLPDIRAYIEAIEKGAKPVFDEEELSKEEILVETVYLSLRTAQGLDFESIKARFPERAELLWNKAKRIADSGLAEINGEALSLNQKGMPLCDRIALELLT